MAELRKPRGTEENTGAQGKNRLFSMRSKIINGSDAAHARALIPVAKGLT